MKITKLYIYNVKWFIKVITQHYADFSGRARRKEYWMYTLFYLIFSFVAAFLDVILTTSFITPLYIIAFLVPNLGVAVRRLHDTGRSGWWLLVGLVPVLSIVILVFYLQNSSPGENQYGPNPKEELIIN